MPSVGMVNWFFAHYRGPVVHALDASSAYDFTWVSDPYDSSESQIPTMNMGAVKTWRRTSTVRLLCGMRWQKGVVAYALGSDDVAVVYTGDVRFLSTWVAALVSRARRRRVLFWTHGWTRPDAGLKRVVRTSFYRCAHALLLYGDHARGIGIRMGFDPQSLYVIGNSMGSPVVWVGERSNGSATRSNSQSWVVITRLIADRRVDAVIREGSRLTSDGRRVDLTVVGDGPERGRLMKLGQELNYPVTFLGAIYDPMVTAEILGAADICLSPGHIGLAAIHALSCGCPVATHGNADAQMPEFEAVRNGVNGVLFQEGNYREMADSAWLFVETNDRSKVAAACNSEIRRRWTADQHALRIAEAIGNELRRHRESARG